eukprot:350770-Chlamydomonas_euryale.AAC.6
MTGVGRGCGTHRLPVTASRSLKLAATGHMRSAKRVPNANRRATDHPNPTAHLPPPPAPRPGLRPLAFAVAWKEGNARAFLRCAAATVWRFNP